MRRLAPLLALVVAGCGGDDDRGAERERPRPASAGDDLVGLPPGGERGREAGPQQTISEVKQLTLLVVDTINRRDASACEFFTQRYLEARAGRPGAAARAACRRSVRRPAGRSEVVDFGRADVAGDRVTLPVRLNAGGEARRYRVTFVRTRADGGWRIDGRSP